MASACPAAAADLKLVDGLLVSTNCEITSLVRAGYAALSGPGSHLAELLTALLTIYIAVFGLRVVLGLGTLRVSALTLAAAKIGLVLALATNWPVYQTLVFDTLFLGPEQFAAGLLGAEPGDRSFEGLFAGLQGAFDELQASARHYAQRAPGPVSPLIGGAAFAAFALNGASIAMLTSTLGVILAVRIVLAGLLMAGPLFVGFLLFDMTRGLFVGWLRAAIVLSLAPLFAFLALFLQLSLMQPHLEVLAEMRAFDRADDAPAFAVLLISMTTGLVTLAGLAAAAFVGLGLRLPGRPSEAEDGRKVEAAPAGLDQAASARPRLSAAEAPGRAASMAAAVMAMDRRDARLMIVEGGGRRDAGSMRPQAGQDAPPAQPLGRSFRRNAQPRRTASGARRDG